MLRALVRVGLLGALVTVPGLAGDPAAAQGRTTLRAQEGGCTLPPWRPIYTGDCNHPESMRAIHRAARNQLGLLFYCEERGEVRADVIEVHRRVTAG